MNKTNFIYIGPNLPHVGLKQFTLYLSSDPPPLLAGFMKSKPALRCLYISTAELAATRGRLQQKGSLEHQASSQLTTLAKAYQESQHTQPST